MSELNPYAEPITAAQLRVGETDFLLNYLDEKMLVPTQRTLVFLGRDVAGDNDGRLYFQDVESYVMLGAYPNTAQGHADIYSCIDSDAQLAAFFDLDQAVAELSKCAARRSKAAGPPYHYIDQRSEDDQAPPDPGASQLPK